MSSNITYSIQILKLNVIPNLKINDTITLQNVVSSVVFNYSAIRTSDSKQCIITNEIPLDIPTSNSNYTDYHSLTQAEVIGWLQNNTELINRLNKNVDDYFNSNQVITMNLPWSS